MINNNQLYRDLLIKLPTSNGSIRKELAYRIYKEKGKLKDFSSLLYINELTANRFLWLLSDLAQLSPNIIKEYLPYLLSIKESIKSKTIESSFANLWLLVGVPLENEAEVTSLLFEWSISAKTNVTVKSRSFLVLANLTLKYPDLKNELILCLKSQKNKYSNNFDAKINRLSLF